MELHQVLVRPIVTEKTTGMGDGRYAFQVRMDANKVEVASAIERFYGVSVADVRTLIVRGKEKRFGRFTGRRSNWKKAYVTLAEGQTLGSLEG
jgi:large subunit ribosomal protein L23